MAELLVKDAISSIFLNPLVWLYTAYKVQRELYMFLIQQFDNDPRLLKSLCRLPRVLDIIRQFYWDNAKSRFAVGSKLILRPTTEEVIGERPSQEEIRKIRLVLLSLGEMSLRCSFFIRRVGFESPIHTCSHLFLVRCSKIIFIFFKFSFKEILGDMQADYCSSRYKSSHSFF